MNIVIVFENGKRVAMDWSNEFDLSRLKRFIFECYGTETYKIIQVKKEIIL